jgi:hypothetical protein
MTLLSEIGLKSSHNFTERLNRQSFFRKEIYSIYQTKILVVYTAKHMIQIMNPTDLAKVLADFLSIFLWNVLYTILFFYPLAFCMILLL